VYYFTADTEVNIPFEFIVDNELVVPEVDSVFYTLRDNDGSVLASNKLVETFADTTKAIITITASHNSIDTDIEKRTVILSYIVNNIPYSSVIHYKLTTYLNHTVTHKDVRAVLGVEPRELPDHSIDIISSYFDVKNDLTAVLATVLTAGDRTSLLANKAITYKAAMNALFALQSGMLSEEASDNISYKKLLDRFDFHHFAGYLNNTYRDLIRQIDSVGDTNITFVSIATPTDPITGV